MYDLTVADIDPYMSAIIYDISGLRLRVGHPFACTRLCIGASRQRIAEILKHSQHKSGTIRPIGQAGAAGHVGVSNILAGKFRYLLPLTAARGCRLPCSILRLL